MTASPWDALPEDVILTDAPIAERGRYYHRLKTIVLRRGMRLVEQRSVLWHELIHAERGDEACDERTETNRIEREAARRAIDVFELADAMRWSDQLAEVADELKVTEDLLRVRLDHLHPAERGLLCRADSIKERTA